MKSTRNVEEPLNSVTSMMEATAIDGKSYNYICLPLSYLNGWLFGIDDKRIKNEATRRRVIQYKQECYQALSDYWLQGSAIRKPRHLQFEPSYDFTPLNLSGSRTVPDAQKLLAEIKKHMTPATQPLVRELEDTLVSIWTNTDEAMHRMTVAQNMMKRVRGHHPD
ncbi:phage antirepressor N-terminal domain-containing protein [Oceanospirillum sediminis]